jgi:C4-type Zn-finger protein
MIKLINRRVIGLLKLETCVEVVCPSFLHSRCANCFECPSCGNTLSTRATDIAIPSDNPEEKATAKKVFYLACGFCRWSTRDVAIPDRNNGR